ncbi:MAG: TIR domain-containing protein, partial [Promethearchaeota archaeon]
VEAIEKAKVFVLILTKRINSSKQVEQEVELAAINKIPIQPFRTENVEPSPNLQYFLKRFHYIDALTPPLEKHLSKLANLILRYYY